LPLTNPPPIVIKMKQVAGQQMRDIERNAAIFNATGRVPGVSLGPATPCCAHTVPEFIRKPH
jgi:hypothetical protein